MSDRTKEINPYYENVRRILSLNMTPAARIVFIYLLDRQGKNEDAWPGIETIRKDCSLTRQTIITALHILSGEPDPQKKDKKPGKAYIKKIAPKAHSKYRVSNSYKILKDESGLIFIPVKGQSKNCTKAVKNIDRVQSKNCTKAVKNIDPNVSVNNKDNGSMNDFPPVPLNRGTSPKGEDSAGEVIKNETFIGKNIKAGENMVDISLTEKFDLLWIKYPQILKNDSDREIVKSNALRELQKINPNAVEFEMILKALHRQIPGIIAELNKKKGRVMYLDQWLRMESWKNSRQQAAS